MLLVNVKKWAFKNKESFIFFISIRLIVRFLYFAYLKLFFFISRSQIVKFKKWLKKVLGPVIVLLIYITMSTDFLRERKTNEKQKEIRTVSNFLHQKETLLFQEHHTNTNTYVHAPPFFIPKPSLCCFFFPTVQNKKVPVKIQHSHRQS